MMPGSSGIAVNSVDVCTDASGTAHVRVTNCCGRIKISDITMCARLLSVSSKEGCVSAQRVSRLASFRGGAKTMTSEASLLGCTT